MVVTGGRRYIFTDVVAVTTALVVDVGHKAVAGVVAAAGATVAITATGTASSIVVVVVECAHGVVLVAVVVAVG